MSDLISRQAAIDALGTITMYKGSIPHDTAVMKIEQLPSVQRAGKWINVDVVNKSDRLGFLCSACNMGGYQKFRFCPHYGAKMEKEKYE